MLEFGGLLLQEKNKLRSFTTTFKGTHENANNKLVYLGHFDNKKKKKDQRPVLNKYSMIFFNQGNQGNLLQQN